MGVLTSDISTLHMGDLYESVDVVFAAAKWDEYLDAQNIASNAFKSCPLEKWPEEFIECVKSQINIEILGISEESNPIWPDDGIEYRCTTAKDGLFTIYAYKNRSGLFGAAMKVASKTVGLDLVPVVPLDPPQGIVAGITH